MNFDIYCSAFLRNHRTQCRIRLHILCRDVSILLRQRYLPQQQLATVVHTHLLLIEVPQYPVSQLYQLSEIGGPNLGLPTVTETQRNFCQRCIVMKSIFTFTSSPRILHYSQLAEGRISLLLTTQYYANPPVRVICNRSELFSLPTRSFYAF